MQGCYDDNQPTARRWRIRLDHFEGKNRKGGLATGLQAVDWEGDGELTDLVPEKCSSGRQKRESSWKDRRVD
jgi:hypothetical protein